MGEFKNILEFGRNKEKIDALEEKLNKKVDLSKWSEDLPNAFYLENGEGYLVVDGKERQEALREEIKQTIQYFRASFLAEHLGIPEKILAIALENGKEYEVADALLEYIEENDLLETIVNASVDVDGYGHFLSYYDGKQRVLINGFYAYRQM